MPLNLLCRLGSNGRLLLELLLLLPLLLDLLLLLLTKSALDTM
jgi:hypothetical protein